MQIGIKFLLCPICICATGVANGATCPSGTNIVSNVNVSTFANATDGACDFLSGGYVKIDVPDGFDFLFNGFLSGGTVSFRGSNTSVTCDNNNVGVWADASTFMAPVQRDEDIYACTGSSGTGYILMDLVNDLVPRYNGFISGSVVTLCDNGYWSGTTCVPYDYENPGDCNENYYDLGINADSFADLTNGTCTNPYYKFTKTTRCDRNAGDTCLVLNTPIINLNWYNGDNVISQNSCYYEEDIQLPTIPLTRSGYTFVGWRLKTE